MLSALGSQTLLKQHFWLRQACLPGEMCQGEGLIAHIPLSTVDAPFFNDISAL